MNSRVPKSDPPPVPPPAPVPPEPAPRVWTSLELIQWTTQFFAKKGIESARLEAELLLAEVLQCPRIQLYVNFEKPVAPEALARFRDFVKRRGDTREPLQYILGHTDFIDLKIALGRDVLIPRPETEELALWAVERLKERSGETLRTLDLCTGSGCLALYIAKKEPRASVIATDLSDAALATACANAKTLEVSERVAFHAGDLFAACESGTKFDLIVANPPYIDPAERPALQPEVRDHEPALALFADENGFAILRRIIDHAAEWMSPGAWLGLEFGKGQETLAKECATKTGAFSEIEVQNDLHRVPRFLQARVP
jgi:release factor glutamine methyltransferase